MSNTTDADLTAALATAADVKDVPATPDGGMLQDKFDDLKKVLNVELVERREEISAAVLATLSETSLFMLGQPGVAKSMLPDRMFSYISGATHFDILMTRFTEPPEMFGPQSLKGLKEDRFVRQTDGYLPTATSAMIDEIWKSNSAILNSLLWILNERKYRHDREIIPVPLKVMFCASNELPQDESLNALYDRIMFRFVVQPVRDQSNFIKMLNTRRPDSPPPILTWEDVETAQRQVRQVDVPMAVLEALGDLRRELKEMGIEPSERRFVNSLKIVRAAAWLDDCTEADTEHLRPLEHVLWMLQEQRPEVSKLILAKANPLENEANKLLQDIGKLEQQLNNVKSDDEKQRVGNEVNGKLRRAKAELDDLRKRSGNSRRRSERIDEVQDRLAAMTDRVLIEIFGFSAEEAADISKS